MILEKISNLKSFVTGAGIGSLAGSFLVHCADTIITRKIFLEKSKKDTILNASKALIKSYAPVGLWIVPSRTIALGVYGFSQEFFYPYIQSSIGLKALSAAIAGCSLSLMSAPAEALKTKKQLYLKGNTISSAKFSEYFIQLYDGLMPLSLRVIPTMTCMLAGTEFIQSSLPISYLNHGPLGMFISALFASFASQVIAVPFENLRIIRMIESINKRKNLKESFMDLAKSHRLYAGYLPRSLSLGIQAGFTLSAAYGFEDVIESR